MHCARFHPQPCKNTMYSRATDPATDAISLRSADGSPLKILACIRFALTLGNASLPMKVLVLPNLGPDARLNYNSILSG